MWISIKYFFYETIKKAWLGIIFVFFDLTDIYKLIKPLLPKRLENLTLPNGLGMVIGFLILLWAAFMAFHNLRKKKIAECLEYSHELKKDKIFRIFSNLYKEGEFLKDAGTVRRQEWDEKVLIKMQKYCNFAFRLNYLIDTGRKPNIVSLLEDEYYDKAVSIIKDYLDNMFEHYTK